MLWKISLVSLSLPTRNSKSSSFESISGFQWSSMKTNSPLHVELFVISGSSDILWMPHELQLYFFLYLEFLHHVPWTNKSAMRAIASPTNIFETRWQIMSVVQGHFASHVACLMKLHLAVVVMCLLSDTLEAKESYICKCEDFTVEDRPFVAIWNAPTGGCSVNYSININLREFDILENPKQTWDGKYVTVFYNAQLGLYPYFTNAEGTNSYNGGMPQVCKFVDIVWHCLTLFIALLILIYTNFAFLSLKVLFSLKISRDELCSIVLYCITAFIFYCKAILVLNCECQVNQWCQLEIITVYFTASSYQDLSLKFKTALLQLNFVMLSRNRVNV